MFHGYYVCRGILLPYNCKIQNYEIEEAYVETERGPVYQVDGSLSVPFIYVIKKREKESFQVMNQRAKDKVILEFCRQWMERWHNMQKG